MSSIDQSALSGGSIDYQAGWKDKGTLHRLYVDKDMSAGEIASVFDVTRSKVKYRLQKHGICRHEQLEGKPDKEKIQSVYQEERTVKATIEALPISRHWCLRLMNHYGITREKSVNRSAPCNYQTNTAGYEVWGHPESKEYNGHTILVHRLVMVAEYGFNALCGKDVHHKNTLKWDNRPENLELTTKGDHNRRHQEGVPLSVELANTPKEKVIAALHDAGYSDIISENA